MFDLGTDVAVIGAGPVGLLSAILLANRGYRVHVFETRPDSRNSRLRAGRSISFTLTARGWKALTRAEIEPQIRELSMPLEGRMIHLEHSSTRFQPYGANGEAIDAVSRNEVVRALTELAESNRGITLHFEYRCVEVRPEEGLITFECLSDGDELEVHSRRILAADGSNSAVRLGLTDRAGFSLEKFYSRHFYREIAIPALPNGDWVLEPNALHVWPREDYMLVAFPQPERAFTATLFMPLDGGSRSFNSLSSPNELVSFFNREFADVVDYMPRLVADFYSGAPSSLVTIRCFPWTFGGTTALVGDAAHAMFPFLGQGLNSGLEDAFTLIDRLEACHDDWEVALDEYETMRKPNCDAVTDLAAQHYGELAQNTRDPNFVVRKRIEAKLTTLLPDQFVSPYHIVSFSDRPYLEVQAIAELQEKVLDRLMTLNDIERRSESLELDEEIRSIASAALEEKFFSAPTLRPPRLQLPAAEERRAG